MHRSSRNSKLGLVSQFTVSLSDGLADILRGRIFTGRVVCKRAEAQYMICARDMDIDLNSSV